MRSLKTERNRKESRLAGLASLMAGGIVNKGFGAVRLLIFAPLLGPSAFGALRLAVSASSILSALTGLGLYTSYVRYLPEMKEGERRAAFLKKTLLYSMTPSLIFGAALLLFSEKFSGLLFSSESHKLLASLVAASLPVCVLYRSALGAANGLGRFRRSAVAEAMQNALYFFIGAGALVFWGKLPEAAMGAFLLGMTAAILYVAPSLPLALKSPPPARDVNPYLYRALSYSLWYALIPLCQYLFDFIDRWMLARFRNLETAGSYSIVPILSGGMLIFGVALTVIVARKGAQLIGRGFRRGARRLVWSSVFLVILGSLFYSAILSAAAPLIWKMVRPEWRRAAPILPLFLSYFTFYNIYYLLGCFASFSEKTWVHLVALAVGAAVNAALNLALVPSYGMMGAAAGTLVGLLTSTLIFYIFILRLRIKIPRRFYLGIALAFSPLLGWPVLIVLAPAAGIISWKTNLLLSPYDRRLALVAWARLLKKFRGKS